MPIKYWSGSADLGTVTNWTSSANWFLGSGGTGDPTTQPTSSDDVILDANSGLGTIAINSAVSCSSLDATYFQGSLSGSSAATLFVIASASRAAVETPLFSWGASMTQSYTGTTTLGASGSGWIFCNGKAFSGSVIFSSSFLNNTASFKDYFITQTSSNVSLVAGNISIEAGAEFGTISTSTTAAKSISGSSLVLTGVGSLSTVGGTQLVSSIGNVYVTGSTAASKTLTFDTQFNASTASLAGIGTGPITASLGTTKRPAVLITNTGQAPITFTNSTLGPLTFQPGTNVNWNNVASQAVTIAGNLTLVGTMTSSATPDLILSSSNFTSIDLAGKQLRTGSLTINTTNAITINNALTSSIAINLFTSSVITNNDISSSTLTLGGGSSLTPSLDTKLTVGSLTITSGSINLSLTTSSIGTVSLTAGTISSSKDLIIRTFSANGNLPKTIITPNLYFTGSGALYTSSSLASLTSTITNIHVTESTSAAKNLLLDNLFNATNIYLGGNGSGQITASFGTTRKPNVFVTNKNGARITFGTSTSGDVVFSTGSIANWFNVTGQILTIAGNLTLTSSTDLQSSPSLILSGSTCTSIDLAGKNLANGDLTINTPNKITISSSNVNSININIFSSSVDWRNDIKAQIFTLGGGSSFTPSASSIFNAGLAVVSGSIDLSPSINTIRSVSLTAGTISSSQDIVTPTITTLGTGPKKIIVPNIYLSGDGTLYSAGGATNLTTTASSIYVTGSTSAAKNLLLDNFFNAPNIYLAGTGSGPITASFGTTIRPNVYVTNTGQAPILFRTSTSGPLAFVSGTNVNWNNTQANQTLTIAGNLTLTGSMTSSITPNLILSGSNFTSIDLAGKELRTGFLTINTTNAISITGSLTSSIAINIFSSSLELNNEISSSTITLGGGARLTPSGPKFTVRTLAITSGSINLSLATSSIGNISITAGNVSSSKDLTLGNLTIASGTTTKVINTPNLLYTGTGSLYTSGTLLSFTPPLTAIYVTGSSAIARTLSFDSVHTASLVYLGGTGPGVITANLGSGSKPNVYVTNIGAAHISFNTSTISSLSFISSSTANWNNVPGQTLTITGSLTLSSSINTTATPNLLLSGSGFTSIELAGRELKIGSLTINTPNAITISGSLLGNIPINIFSSSVVVSSSISSSTFTLGGGSIFTASLNSRFNIGALNVLSGSINLSLATSSIGAVSLTAGTISSSKDLTIGNLTIASGTTRKTINTPNLLYTGTGSLYTNNGTNLSFIPPLTAIYVTGSAASERILTFDTIHTASLVYLGGSGVGKISADLGTTKRPNVYVTNTGQAPISFATSTIASLSFISGSNVNWDNLISQNLTITGSLTLTGSMTSSATPNLILSGSNFTSIDLAGKELKTGSLTINTPNLITISGSLTSSIAINIFSSSVAINNDISSSTFTLGGGSSFTPFLNSKFNVVALTISSGSINLDPSINTIGTVTLTTGAISSSKDLTIGNLIVSGSSIKTINTPNILYTGIGSLYSNITNSTNLKFTPPLTAIYVTGSTTSTRTLSFDPMHTASLVYLAGNGSGIIIADLGSGSKPNVYVTNTGQAPISFETSIISSLSFTSGSTAKWDNTAGRTLTIAGNLTLTGSMTSSATPNLILSGSNFTSIDLTNKELKTGSLTINTPNLITISGSLTSSIAINIFTSSVKIENNISSSTFTLGGGSRFSGSLDTKFNVGALAITSGSINLDPTINTIGDVTLAAGNISSSKDLTIATLLTTGSGAKIINTPNLLFTGIGTLYTNSGTNFTFTPPLTAIYVTGSAASDRILTFDNILTASLVYLAGNGTGYIKAGLGSGSKPNVYVTNTGQAPISFFTSTISGLSFVSGSTANWNNQASQTLTIVGNLALTSSMSSSATPNLILSGSNFTSIDLVGKELQTGSLTINTPNLITISGSLTSSIAINIFSSSIKIQNDISSSTFTLGGGSRFSGSLGTNFNVGALAITSGSINLDPTINTIGAVSITAGNISSSRDLLIGTLSATIGSTKTINTPNILYTGIGSLYLNTSTDFNFIPLLTAIYVTGSAAAGRTLTFDSVHTASLVYLGGDGIGPITSSFLAIKRPNVYVTNTGQAPITFVNSTISSLSFVSSSNVNWNNVVGNTLTIVGNLALTGSMTSSATPSLLLSSSNFTSIDLAGKELAVGSLTINTPNLINISGSLTSSIAINIFSSSVKVQNDISSSAFTLGGGSRFSGSLNSKFDVGALNILSGSINLDPTINTIGAVSITAGNISSSKDLTLVNLTIASGTTTKIINTPNLLYTGIDTLYTNSGTNFTFTPPLTAIYVTGSSAIARTLTFDTVHTASLVYLGGDGIGEIVANLGTTKRPNVYVTNTGQAPISFETSIISGLSFISSSNVDWNNAAGRTLTIAGNLTLTGSMTSSATPNLILSGSNFTSIDLAGKELRTGDLTINTPNVITISSSLTSSIHIYINSSSVKIENDITSPQFTIQKGSSFTPFLNSKFTAQILYVVTSGSINLSLATSSIDTLTISEGIVSSSKDLTIGTLTSATGNGLRKIITAPNLIFTGSGMLYTETDSNITSSIGNIYVTGSSANTKTLLLSNNFNAPNIYLAGNGTGTIAASFGTTRKPNVYVTTTGGPTSISFYDSTIANLSFISSSTANWNNQANQTLTIAGNLTLTGSMTSSATPNLLLSGSGFTSIDLAGKELRTGDLTINTPNIINISGSLTSSIAINIFSSSVKVQNNISSSTFTLGGGSRFSGSLNSKFDVGALQILSGSINLDPTINTIGTVTLTEGIISSSKGLTIGNLVATGATTKVINTPNLLYTGIDTLYTNNGSNLTFTPPLTAIYVTGSATAQRILTFDTTHNAPNTYLAGNGSGYITANLGTTKRPNVYVTNTGQAQISFNSSTISGLSFISGSTANWNNVVVQDLTIAGNLTLTGSMTSSATPNLILSGSNFTSIDLANKELKVGSLTINTPNIITISSSLTSSGVAINIFNSSVKVENNISSSVFTLGGGSSFTPFLNSKFTVGTLTVNSGSIDLSLATSSLSSVDMYAGTISSSKDVAMGNLTTYDSTTKKIIIPNLSFHGTNQLYDQQGLNVTSSISNIYVTGSTNSLRILILDDDFYAPSVYLAGNGIGNITAGFGTTRRPDIYVTNTGRAPISFETSTISSLSFVSSSNVEWYNIAGEYLTIAGKLTLTGSMTSSATPNLTLSGSNFTSIDLAGKELKVGSLTIDTPNRITVSGSLTSSISVDIIQSPVTVMNNFSSSQLTLTKGGKLTPSGSSFTVGALTVTSGSVDLGLTTTNIITNTFTHNVGTVSASKDITLGNLYTQGGNSANAVISTPNLLYTGIGNLYVNGDGTFSFTPQLTAIYVTGSAASPRILTFTIIHNAPLVYLAGDGTGQISADLGTTKRPNVYVTNTGQAPISFETSTISSLSYISGSTANWSNAAGKNLTIAGNLTLTGSMTVTQTSNLILSSSAFNSIELASKELKIGDLTINTPNAITISGSLTSSGAVTVYTSSLTVMNDFSSSGLTLGGGGRFTPSGSSFTAGALTVSSGSVDLGLTTTNIVAGQLSLTAGTVYSPNNLSIGSFLATGAGVKELTTPNLYFPTNGTLYTSASLANLTPSITNIYITGSTPFPRTLTLDNIFNAPNIYLAGNGSGLITAGFGTTKRPNVYVTNTGGATISFSTSTSGPVIFSNGTTVTWDNVTGETLTIGGNLTLTSSMTVTETSNLILSGSNFTSIELAGKELKIGSLTINTPNAIIISGSLTSSGAVTVHTSSVAVQNDFSSSGLTLGGGGTFGLSGSKFTAGALTVSSGSVDLGLTTTNIVANTLTINQGTVSASEDITLGNLAIGSGTATKTLNTPNLLYTGISNLYTNSGDISAFNITPELTAIYVTGSATAQRILTFDSVHKTGLVYLAGSGSGTISASLGSTRVPYVYVTNTGRAPISFSTSRLNSLFFISSSNVNWSNVAGQDVTITEKLELTGSMTSSATPNLILSGSSFTSLKLVDKQLKTGNLTIDTPNAIEVSGSLISNAAVTILSSSVAVTNNFSSSTLTLDDAASITAPNTISIGPLYVLGTLRKSLIADTVYYTGTSSLPLPAVLNFTSSMNTLYYNGSTAQTRLIDYDSQFRPSTIFLGGAGGGSITGSFGTIAKPNVYVTSTAASPITFATSTISSLSFISSSTANWNNVAGQTLTITGSLALSSSISTTATPNLLLSGSGFNSLSLVEEQLKTGTLTILETPDLNVTGSILSNAPVTIINSAVAVANNFSSSILTLENAELSASNNIYVDSILAQGASSNKISATSLHYLGTGSLLNFAPVQYTSSITNILISGSSATSRSIEFSPTFYSTNLYIGGTGTGPITASLGTSGKPNVFVNSTSPFQLSFLSAAISNLLFISTTRANWNNTNNQTLNISGSLTLGNLTDITSTPDLVFNGNGTIKTAGKVFTKSIKVESPYTQSLLDNFSSSGSITIEGFLSASNMNILSIGSLNVLGNCNISSSTVNTITVTGTGSAWIIPTTSTIYLPNTTIKMSNTSNSAVTFSGGSPTYGEVVFARGSSNGINHFQGSNTFTNLRDTGTSAHTMSLATGTTQTVGHFDVKGTPGNRVYLTGGSLSKSPAGLVMSDYLDVVNSTATSGSGPWTWFAGPNSTLTGTTTGWLTTGSEGTSVVRRLGSQGVG